MKREKLDMPARPILDVYLTAITDDTEIFPVASEKRSAYIAAASHARVRRERYTVWRLLERGIERSFDLRAEALEFTEKDGIWSCDGLSFSLSHSRGVAAAAVSNGAVGVDVESVDGFASRVPDFERVARRICSDDELARVKSRGDLLRIWTKKESIFKCIGEGGVFLKETDAAAHETLTRELKIPAPCILSVCGESLPNTRIFIVSGDDVRPISNEDITGG